MANKPETVEEYIENFPKESQPIIYQLQKLIISQVPEVEERIAWNVPNYKLKGVLAGFAVYSKHVSLGFSGNGLSKEERKKFEDNGYKTGKATIQIRFDQKVPKELVVQTLKAHSKRL